MHQTVHSTAQRSIANHSHSSQLLHALLRDAAQADNQPDEVVPATFQEELSIFLVRDSAQPQHRKTE
jgi:hypothetical protein